MVRVGFCVAWFLAASPMRRSSSVKATYEGVILSAARTQSCLAPTLLALLLASSQAPTCDPGRWR